MPRARLMRLALTQTTKFIQLRCKPTGKILVGGQFNGANSIGGQTRNYIARLDAATGLADSFDPNAGGNVNSIVLQADGRILVGGRFVNIGGRPIRPRPVGCRGTSLADSFNAIVSGSDVFSIGVQKDGKILVGGDFTSVGGQMRSRFARLTNDIAAIQNLNVFNQGAIWTLGGSSPRFTRVTFEYSTDNVNYAFAVNGTPSGSNWTFLALSFPRGQNSRPWLLSRRPLE